MVDAAADELLLDATPQKLPLGSTHSTADMISTDGELKERLPLDEDDIEKAAEQVVDEWTNRLQGVDDTLYDEAQAKEGEDGEMAIGSDIESGMSTTPVPEQEKNDDDDDDYDSGDDDDDDDYFLLRVALPCVCFVTPFILFVLPILYK